jgi:small redox-active disulfide protein 2
MKKLTIEWKHFDKDGKTCERCGETGTNLKQVIGEISPALSQQGTEIKYIETRLDAKDMPESNSVFINGASIESLLNASVSENSCTSCGDLIDSECNCRTVTVDETTYEAIPTELIKEAILISLNKINNLKGNNMNVQVLGSGCPTCKKLYEITQQAVKELNLETEVEYSTDVSKIIEMGIMSSPVLAVNGRPVMTGFTPDVEKIKKAITTGAAYEAPKSTCSCGGNC